MDTTDRSGWTNDTCSDSSEQEEDVPTSRQSSQMEKNDWSTVNKKLKHHGLPAVKISSSAQVSLLSDHPTCKVIRENIISLLQDCSHRQNLVQDLIVTNNQIQTEIAKQTALTEKYCSKLKDYKMMADSSKTRVSDTDAPSSQMFHSEREKLINTKNAIHAKCQQLEIKCLQKQSEIDKLEQRLHRMEVEEEKRSQRQTQVFKEFKKRTSRAHSAMDQKMLDVIDAYERQISTLQNEMEALRLGGSCDDVDDSRQSETSYRTGSVLKSYDQKLKQANRTVKQLEEEVELMKLDMGARPEVKDYRVAQQRVKKLERLLSTHNISIPGENNKKDPFRLKRKYSTKFDDLDYLPLDLCRHYLKEVNTELELEDLEQIVPGIQALKNVLDSTSKYQQFSRQVQDLVDSLDDLSSGSRKQRSASPKHKSRPVTEESLQHVFSVLEHWRTDESALQELQVTVNQLSERVAPWLKLNMTGEASVSRILDCLHQIVYDDGSAKHKGQKEHPSRPVLENIVEHFQTLFDVPCVSGVYPRMNDIYVKLGEVHNVLNTLRNLLGLSTDTRSSAIVDAVGKLCTSHNATTSQQLRSLLQTEDLDGVIRRLQEHANFLPAFQEVMYKLFEILSVRQLDDVVPAVRELKILAR
ncbi:hypothetical protein ScPMuIL_013478 [Solemya velum]